MRSQWLKRLVEFSAQQEVKVQLAYYPPYHSKYNPIERVFGVLENYWNGDPLRTVTYNKVHPVVGLVTNVYAKGVKLNNRQRRLYEKALDRLQDLGKWFITILPDKAKAVCLMADQLD
jgi:hypothetical protein